VPFRASVRTNEPSAWLHSHTCAYYGYKRRDLCPFCAPVCRVREIYEHSARKSTTHERTFAIVAHESPRVVVRSHQRVHRAMDVNGGNQHASRKTRSAAARSVPNMILALVSTTQRSFCAHSVSQISQDIACCGSGLFCLLGSSRIKRHFRMSSGD